jgi:hypothetical protein
MTEKSENPNNYIVTSMKYYSAGQLFAIAKSAYDRTVDDKTERSSNRSDTLISIIFAAASLEAFINELADKAAEKPVLLDHPESVRNLAVLLKELEETRASTRLKFMITKLVFTGKIFDKRDKDDQTYQDFLLLSKLRDSLIHLKPQDEVIIKRDGTSETKVPKFMKEINKDLLADFDEKVIASWVSRISTRAMAEWACNTAAEMVSSIIVILPDSHFRKDVISSYGKTFTPAGYKYDNS